MDVEGIKAPTSYYVADRIFLRNFTTTLPKMFDQIFRIPVFISPFPYYLTKTRTAANTHCFVDTEAGIRKKRKNIRNLQTTAQNFTKASFHKGKLH